MDGFAVVVKYLPLTHIPAHMSTTLCKPLLNQQYAWLLQNP